MLTAAQPSSSHGTKLSVPISGQKCPWFHRNHVVAVRSLGIWITVLMGQRHLLLWILGSLIPGCVAPSQASSREDNRLLCVRPAWESINPYRTTC